jgi:hypothetical protein
MSTKDIPKTQSNSLWAEYAETTASLAFDEHGSNVSEAEEWIKNFISDNVISNSKDNAIYSACVGLTTCKYMILRNRKMS